jgi:hypothetical protein
MQMSDVKQTPIVPMANLVHGAIFDKRQLQTPFERVVKAVTKINPEFGALLEAGKGYTLLVEPVTLAMMKALQEQMQQPPAQPQYMRQPHQVYGGYGIMASPGAQAFGVVPNGQDRVMVLNIRPDANYGLDLNAFQAMTPSQLMAIQFDQMVARILGDGTSENRGFVEEE